MKFRYLITLLKKFISQTTRKEFILFNFSDKLYLSIIIQKEDA